MTVKQKMPVVLVIIGFLLASALPVYAQPQWYVCDVNSAGPAVRDGIEAVYIKLTHREDPPAFEKKWFRAPPRWEREMLAIALAAMSSNRTVMVKTDLLSEDIKPVLVGMHMRRK